MIPDDLQISLEFYPSFLPSCKMVLRREIDAWSFSIAISGNEGAPSKNRTANTKNEWYTDSIIKLGRRVVNEAIKDNRIILDGISLQCTVIENDIEKVHQYHCPENGKAEWLFAIAFLECAEKLFNDPQLTNYIELLEGYFGRFPAKLFEETPRRLRLYGSLSIHHDLRKLIEKVANDHSLVLDLSNLEGMGTILYEQFTPLKAIPDLTVLVNGSNKWAMRHVKEIGFKDEQVVLI